MNSYEKKSQNLSCQTWSIMQLLWLRPAWETLLKYLGDPGVHVNGHTIFRVLLLNCDSDGKRLGSYLIINVKVLLGFHLNLNKKIMHHQKENPKPTNTASQSVATATWGDGIQKKRKNRKWESKLPSFLLRYETKGGFQSVWSNLAYSGVLISWSMQCL